VDEPAALGWPSWVGLVVDDLPSQQRFWSDLLGRAEDYATDDYVQFDMGDGRLFELVKRSSEPEYDDRRFQMGFVVEDITHARDELLARDVEQISEISDDSEAPWAYFRDPEGNVFAIKQRVAR
jgi:catechol-2,3-dioxygenase